MNKRQFLQRAFAGVSTLALAGCDRLNMSPWFTKVLSVGESINQGVHQFVGGRVSMAQEFSVADLSPTFRGNGSINPDDPAYRAVAAEGFVNWTLTVDGLVETPSTLTLAQLRAIDAALMPATFAVITPSGDPFSMLALAIPLSVLYVLSVLIGWLLVRRRPAT